MTTDAEQNRRQTVPILALLAGASALFTLGILLLGIDSDTCLAVAAILMGFSAMIVAYAWWLLLHPRTDWRNPAEFAKETCKPILTILAVLGVALVIQGAGALAGWEALRAAGDALARLFGGS